MAQQDDWYLNAVFYELYLRAFTDSDGDGYGDLDGLRTRLDYLQWLGIDCIWIPPIYPSPLRDDGYDISSFYGIDPMYGLMENLMMTLDEVHRRGMRLIMDLVLNHTSDQHPWFREARRSKDSPLRDYFVWSDTDDKYRDARIIFIDTEKSNWAYDEVTGQYYWHRFFSHQPDLNYDNDKVQEEMLSITRFWLDIGIDGFRVDAVPYLFEREESNCENLTETHGFLKKLRRVVDEEYPGRLLLAEANQWPHDVVHYFGDLNNPSGDEFQMCFHFPVMPRLYMALAQNDRRSVVDILSRTPDIPDRCQWATFLRNHDELTLEMVTEEERDFMWNFYATEPRERLNLGIRRRLAPLMENDRRRIELMYSMLFTLPGAPVLYYGDEIGMGDNLELPDRNGVRTPMQWNDRENAGFSDARLENLYAPPVTGPEFGYSTVNVLNQNITPDSLLNTVRGMILTRKGLSVLGKGKLEWIETLPKQALCFWRLNDEQRFLALHNLSEDPITVPLPEGEVFDDPLSRSSEVITGSLTLESYGFRWLLTKQDQA
jgi:maltose alpha-D-glucosyltransferase/alpha-amylase